MATTNEIRKIRANDVLTAFCSSGSAVFFTLTTPDVVDITEIRSRWRNLRHYLIQEVFPRGVKYVMNYEIHPNGHGWHIHSVFNHYVPLKRIMKQIRSYGFGRVDVRRVNSLGVADYLTKHALKAYRGLSKREREKGGAARLRLVNTSRGLPRLSDYRYVSEYLTGLRFLLRSIRDNSLIPAFRKMSFCSLYRLVELSYLCGVRSNLVFWDWYNNFRLGRLTCYNSIEGSFDLLDSLDYCALTTDCASPQNIDGNFISRSEEKLRYFEDDAPYFGRAQFKNSI